ncbi:hypothetical protein HY045_00275 [Candidatus Woesebacteria bacterium]|nr:hypothetical protein [Candidatus Woesebacteria bacterium]
MGKRGKLSKPDMNIVKKASITFILILLHTTALIVVIYSFLPMAKWYFDNKPLWGVDFFYTASLVNVIKENIALPPAIWNYAWSTGWPMVSSFPILHYFLILPLTLFFPIIISVKLWMMITLGLFFIGCYACFYILSKNHGLSVVLTIAAIYSVGVYGTLMWGGSLPNHATQAFLPWTIFYTIRYLQKKSFSNILFSGFLSGLAILGHPQIAISYIFPSVLILLLFSFGEIKLLQRIKAGIIFGVVAVVIGFPILYSSVGSLRYFIVKDSFKIASSTVKVDMQLERDIKAFHSRQPLRMYIDTNTTIFILLGISLAGFLFAAVLKRKSDVFTSVIPYIILAGYFAIYIWIFSFGISIFHGGWYRLFWATPLWLGLPVAALLFQFQDSIESLMQKYKYIVRGLFNVAIILVSIPLLIHYSSDIREKIILRSNPSSAFPDIINLYANNFESLTNRLTPDWLDANRTDYRLYDADQTVNIWWSALYKMPLGRGYLDPPLKQTQGFTFWLDAALSFDSLTGKDQLASSFNYPEDIGFNNTLYLLDWYSIKFIEGVREGTTVTALLPKELTKDYFIHDTLLDFNNEKYEKGNKTLRYFELKDDLTSPILTGTNAPTIGVFATDAGYETVVRAMGDANLNSKKVIPLKLGNYLDKVNENDLKGMDALILYDYSYYNKNASFKKIENYVNNGGKIFVDTGTEVGEANSEGPLPKIFPIDKTFRKSLGSSWDLSVDPSNITNGVDFTKFDPPIFDNGPWNISFPRSESDTRPNSKVIVRNHGTPILISKQMGSGEVIWSGINFPYHTIRFHNSNEITLFANIISELVPLNKLPPPASVVSFESAQKRSVLTSGATGVLFKEENYPGWSAGIGDKRVGNSISAKIWKAGPAYPGFMYVRIPKKYSGQNAIVTFNFSGVPLTWIFSVLSFTVAFIIAEKFLLRGLLFGRGMEIIKRKLHLNLVSWWGKEGN